VATGKELVFLVDKGADISIVKENSDVFHDIKDNYIIDIKGIILRYRTLSKKSNTIFIS